MRLLASIVMLLASLLPGPDPAGYIAGVACTKGGLPKGGAVVTIYDRLSFAVVATDTTEADGTYLITVKVFDPPGFPRTLWIDAVCGPVSSERTLVTVQPGGTVTVNLELR